MTLIALSLAFGFSIGGCADPQPTPKNAEWLLAHLKFLIDEGKLFDTVAVGKVLDINLQGKETEMVRQPADCSNPHSDKSDLLQKFEVSAVWFKESSEGVPHMKYPGISINPAGAVGEPRIFYKVFKTTNCSGKFTLPVQESARIEFTGLSTFACLTAHDLANSLHTEFQMATDGVSLSVYRPKPNDRFGGSIEFLFRFGAPCAISATLTQDEAAGYRALRAMAKFKACTDRADRAFCATHPSFTWGEGDKIDEMQESAVKICGGFDSFYKKESLSGEPPPPPPPRQFPATPCSGK
jgi:hypothetical protein